MPALSVLVSGRLAGTASADGAPASTRVGFVYEPEYLSRADATPLSVSAPLAAGRHEIGVWLEGLLSDNPAVRERWQVEHRTPTARAIDLLGSPMGRDCAGAVQFCPPDQVQDVLARGGGVRRLSQRRVAEIIARLRRDEAAWSPEEPDAAFSLGGAQAKTALRYDGGRWGIPYGAEPTTHILKPGVGRFPDSDLVEHLSQRAAAILGIDAAETRCVTARGERALLVTRYDRLATASGGWERIHQEDLCQALAVPAAQKYETAQGPGIAPIAGLLWAVTSDPDTDVRLFRDAIIYNWLIAGTDAHAKNYSLRLRRDEVRLAPLYDLCSYLPYRNHRQATSVQKIKLAMKIGRDYTIHKADYRPAWERTSTALGLPADETLDRVEGLARRVAGAVEAAIEELPRRLRASPHVRSLHKEVEARARHCAFVRHMRSPSQYSRTTPIGGGDASSGAAAAKAVTATRPTAMRRCTHIGVRSNKRCIRPAGHNPPHRYTS